MTEHASLVTRERRPDGVALVTIDNPPVNALTTPLFAELLAISGTYRVRFAGRTGIGAAELDDAVRSVTEPAYIRELGGKYLATFDALAAVPCMVIAAITGIAFGGGLGLALACDYRIASERARLGPPRSRWAAAALTARFSGCPASSAPRCRRCSWGGNASLRAGSAADRACRRGGLRRRDHGSRP